MKQKGLALREDLGVMDTTAIVLCRDNGIPMRVVNIYEPGALTLVAKAGTPVANSGAGTGNTSSL